MGLGQNQVELTNQTAAISATTCNSPGQPGQRLLVTGRVSITDPALLGSIRVRFLWTDKEYGAMQDDYTLLATGAAHLPFTFPVNVADNTALTYQVDFLAITIGGSFEYALAIDTIALFN